MLKTFEVRFCYFHTTVVPWVTTWCPK